MLFRFYIDGQLKLLSASTIGSYIGEICIGALIYVGDIVLRLHLLWLCIHYYQFVPVFMILCLSQKKVEVFIFFARTTMQQNYCSPKTIFKMSGGAIKFLHKWRHLGQGNTLSSFIFNVFVNAFIVKLRLLDVGCHINHQDDGCFL